MKYSVSSRQDLNTLREADEIIIAKNDFESFPVVYEKVPDKTFVFEILLLTPEKADKLRVWRGWTDNIVLSLWNIADFEQAAAIGLKYCFNEPVDSMYNFNALKDLGVEYISISGSLAHNMKAFSNSNVKVRMCPNIAYEAYIPRENGLYGQWVRPEDIEYYENIYIFDFLDCDLQKEKTLLHVYKNDKSWPGNLNLLFSNFDVNVNNLTMPKEIGKTRANCKHKCFIQMPYI